MKKFLALVLAFCLMTAILPAAAEEAGNLLTLFGVSGGEGDAQGAVGTVPEGDSGLNTDSFGNMFGGTDKGEKIYSDEGKDELPGSGNMAGETGNAGGGEIYAGDGEDIFAEIGSMLGGTGTAEHEEIYAGDGEDALGGLGGAADELSESDSMFSGSSRGLDLGSLFGGDSSGIDLDLSSLGSMFGGDGGGIDLDLGSLLGGDGSGLDLDLGSLAACSAATAADSTWAACSAATAADSTWAACLAVGKQLPSIRFRRRTRSSSTARGRSAA